MNTTDQTQLKESLLSLGAEEGDLDEIINDITGVIMERIIAKYFDETDQETQSLVGTMSAAELIDYIAKHKTSFPPLAEERCTAIAHETWADYFQFMKEKTTA